VVEIDDTLIGKERGGAKVDSGTRDPTATPWNSTDQTPINTLLLFNIPNGSN
jgi:hypothetical protein